LLISSNSWLVHFHKADSRPVVLASFRFEGHSIGNSSNLPPPSWSVHYLSHQTLVPVYFLFLAICLIHMAPPTRQPKPTMKGKPARSTLLSALAPLLMLILSQARAARLSSTGVSALFTFNSASRIRKMLSSLSLDTCIRVQQSYSSRRQPRVTKVSSLLQAGKAILWVSH
jgi:hypothetical protein